MSDAKKTQFYDIHVKNHAKIVEFAGYLMPIQFKGIMEEHRKVRREKYLGNSSYLCGIWFNNFKYFLTN